ncbi:MAG: RNA methyltransferase [Bacteroidota bacterium]
MTPQREAKFRRVVSNRQPGLSVLLEDVHDPHNISAVLRTCDSVGIMEIYVLYTSTDIERLKMGKRSSGSARKWVDVHLFTDRTACFEAIRTKYDTILATHLSSDAIQLYEADLSGSKVLVFGNEKEGVSEASLALCDGNIRIPQYGMIESLNISVACAVTLYETLRQRQEKGKYSVSELSVDEQETLFHIYKERTKTGRTKEPR